MRSRFRACVKLSNQAKANRHILLEYVTQLRQTEPAVAGMVMDMLERIDVPWIGLRCCA
jgi:hypothetical protein